jgi:prepilin-type N-terminal cleavage/methylation domain-containing protein
MKKRAGFTLVELIVASLIFAFMMTSLATIYSTSNRYMFQNYRANIIKTNVGVSVKAIQNHLSLATRIDQPSGLNAGTALGASGNVLAFAENVDQMNGCYPITASAPASWHYFCLAPDPQDNTVTDLYYHTGTIAGGPGCPAASSFSYTPPYPGSCGFGGGGLVTILMKNVNTFQPLFSRNTAQNVYERDVVRVILRSRWVAANANFGPNGVQKDVDYTMDSVIKASIPGQQ